MKKTYSFRYLVIICILMSILGISIFSHSCVQKNKSHAIKEIGLDAFPPDGSELAKEGGGEGNFFEFFKTDSLQIDSTSKDDSIRWTLNLKYGAGIDDFEDDGVRNVHCYDEDSSILSADSFEKHPGSKGEVLIEGNEGNIGIHGNSDADDFR